MLLLVDAGATFVLINCALSGAIFHSNGVGPTEGDEQMAKKMLDAGATFVLVDCSTWRSF